MAEASATARSVANAFQSLTQNLQDFEVEFTPFIDPPPATPRSIANVFRSLTRNLQPIDVEFTPFFTRLPYGGSTSDIRKSPAFFPSPDLIRSINGDIPRPYAMSLNEAIQSLPQELQDIILEFTVTSFRPNTVVKIEKGMRPPHLLHINRATRAMAAKAYYSAAAFEFYYTWRWNVPPHLVLSGHRIRALHIWLRSIPSAHRALIARIRVEHTPPSYISGSSARRLGVHEAYEDLIILNEFAGFTWKRIERLKNGVMKIATVVPVEDGKAEAERWVSEGDLARLLGYEA